ncbi:Uncharacterised protein [Moraxella lacunata]|uniref:Uncharacterized protein n=1 Tax=Moraxella lacunata TaxID=477 RepID=A0A378TTB7_MORLA|nr:hypothetical protein [Moraxella lacunata]STZ63564.1 Uncharacterised protein [Moraxella lacunata]
MKTLPKLTLSTLLLFTLTAHAMYIPDLFGAYEQGASRARYENQQDAYYYEEIRRQQLERQRQERQIQQRMGGQSGYYEYSYQDSLPEPRLYVQVINQKTGKDKGHMNLSLKKNDMLCWAVTPVNSAQTYQVSELFTMPVHATFTGNAGQNANNQLISSVQTSSNTAKFGRQIYATKNQLDACWSFPANTPKGIYHIRVGVGGAEFGTQSFKIVN